MSKKNRKIWGIISLVLGFLSIPVLIDGFWQLILGCGAMVFYFIQKKHQSTKPATIGLMAGVVGIYNSFFIPSRIKFLVFILLAIALVFSKIKPIKIKKILKRFKKPLIILGCIAALIIVYLVYMMASPIKCASKDCFVRNAKYCNKTVLKIDEEIGTVKYESSYEVTAPIGSSCTLTKTIVKLHKTESQFMKDILEGKSTSCLYGVGEVNPDWVYSLVSGLDECSETGGLRKAIGDLIIFVD